MNGIRKRLLSVLVMLTLAAGITACGHVQTEDAAYEEEDDKIQIGMSFDSFVIERWQRDRDVFVSVAKELGAEVNVQNANGDVEEQKKQIDYFIKKGMDVIVIISIDADELKESVDKAKKEGIKVIAYDRQINNADVDLYISFDNEKVGTMMALALVSHGITGGNVLMLGGSPTDGNVAMVLLIQNPGKVYSRENLLRLIWGNDYPGDVRTVDVHIRRLREKIEEVPGDPVYVKTKWGVGYYFA